MTIRNDLVVSKSNCIVEASYRLNVSEQRIIALLTAQIHPDDADFKPYRFKVAELEELLQANNKAVYGEVRELTRGLIKRVLQINEPDGPLQIAWLSSAKYFTGKGEVELCFDPKLKPYLLQLQSRFTSYKLHNVIKLRSRYSVRLYELLKQYEAKNKRSFKLDELRLLLGLAEGEFATWKDFRRNVIDLAERELPKKTDIAFSYIARKSGRAVAFVDFTIWATREKDLTAKQVKAFVAGAKKCWADCNGSCGAQWQTHKANKKINCHWCEKFTAQRNELHGQKRLPLPSQQSRQQQQLTASGA